MGPRKSLHLISWGEARSGAWPWQVSVDHYCGNQGWQGLKGIGAIISNQQIVSITHWGTTLKTLKGGIVSLGLSLLRFRIRVRVRIRVMIRTSFPLRIPMQ